MSNQFISRRTMLKSTSLAGLSLLGANAARVVSAKEDHEKPLNIGGRRELFVDDALIASLQGATQRLHRPRPREVVITHDVPWEGTSSGYHSVFQDGDRYRMYYRGFHLDVSSGKIKTTHPQFTCYAESSDGLKWERPELGIVEFQGSKKNNIILTGAATHNFSPCKDTRKDCPADSQYKGLGGGASTGGLLAYHSADGVHWSKMQEEPVITKGAFDSQNLAFWDETLGKYRAYYRIFSKGVTTKEVWKPAGVRAIRTAVSDDFIHWEQEADLTYFDSPAEQLYTNQVAPYIRAPHILIGMPTRYVDRGWSAAAKALPDLKNRELRAGINQRYGTAITEGVLMASRDGVQFKRWNEAFMRPGVSRPGSWQYGQQYIANHVVQTKSDLPGAPDELSLYSTEGYWHGTGGKLRRYTLRLDGFVSITAPRSGGVLQTKPLIFQGGKLSLNMATSAAGSIQVEIQDLAGKPIAGFTKDDCPEHFGDTVDYTMTWKHSDGDVSSLTGKPVRLAFHLNDADLYSFQFK